MSYMRLAASAILGVWVSTANAIAGSAVPVSELDTFFGSAPGEVGNQGLGLSPLFAEGIEGSAIRNTFDFQAGDRISFDYNFLSDEVALIHEDEEFDDYAVVSIDGSLSVLDHVHGPHPFTPSSTPFLDETGTQSFSTSIPLSSSLRFGIGIIDQGDRDVSSGLLIDNISIVRGGTQVFFEGFEGTTPDPSASGIGDFRRVGAGFGSVPPAGDLQMLITTAPDSPAPVPLPPALWMMLSGVVSLYGLAVRRRR